MITKTVFLSAVICVAPLWAANNKQLTVAATVQEEKAEICKSENKEFLS